MWVIDEILWLLKDGKWHNLGDTAKKASVHELTAQTITRFLSSYKFMEFDEENRKVRLRPLTLDFINEIQCIEEEEDINALRLR